MRGFEGDKGKVLQWVLVVGWLVVLAGGTYVFSLYQSLNRATDQMHQPMGREASEKRVGEVEFKEKDPFSVLMLGVDGRGNEVGRSDTMIVTVVNPTSETTSMLSIPRDTLAEIAGRGTKDKINHAFAFGGVEMTIDTVENLLEIPIDYFVQVNMDGFEEIVDAVGGVTVTNNFTFKAGGYTFPKGQLTLYGKEALSYARMRNQDPHGDFGRQERQREVIQAVLKKGASLSSLWNFGAVFDVLGTNIKTNLTLDQIIEIQREYRSAATNVEQKSIDSGADRYINDVYYYVVPEAEWELIRSSLKQQLNI